MLEEEVAKRIPNTKFLVLTHIMCRKYCYLTVIFFSTKNLPSLSNSVLVPFWTPTASPPPPGL